MKLISILFSMLSGMFRVYWNSPEYLWRYVRKYLIDKRNDKV